MLTASKFYYNFEGQAFGYGLIMSDRNVRPTDAYPRERFLGGQALSRPFGHDGA
ncbi:MAG: hypothetical protein GF315_03195 [candidate division Zixibacteria bacterium]|nr:hypothetical protein [candidate division Zixibacteria bacterium]